MPSKKHRTTARAARTTKRPADPALYRGSLDLYDDEQLCRDHPRMSMVTLLTVFKGRTPVLWVNPRRIPVSRYRLVELWARRMIGAGRRFATLDVDDLHAAGLFQEAA